MLALPEFFEMLLQSLVVKVQPLHTLPLSYNLCGVEERGTIDDIDVLHLGAPLFVGIRVVVVSGKKNARLNRKRVAVENDEDCAGTLAHWPALPATAGVRL